MITCEIFEYTIDFIWPDSEISDVEWNVQYYEPAMIDTHLRIQDRAKGRRVIYELINLTDSARCIHDYSKFGKLHIPVFKILDGDGFIGRITVKGVFINADT